jgi:hypothetical protein
MKVVGLRSWQIERLQSVVEDQVDARRRAGKMDAKAAELLLLLQDRNPRLFVGRLQAGVPPSPTRP